MTLARGFKMVDTALRGAKMVASVAKRGGKFLPSIKNLNDIDNLANTVATGMQTAGQYAALGSHLAPGQYGTMRRAAGNSLTKGGRIYSECEKQCLSKKSQTRFWK